MALRATELITLQCNKCNRDFITQFRNLKRGRGKYCSKKCSNSSEVNMASKRYKKVDSGCKDTYRKLFGVHEHRVVMESKLGRKLVAGEVVHHIDGNKRNNNPDNLELYDSNAMHLRDHLRKNIGVCVIDGCNKHQKKNHMCYMHDARIKRHGNPNTNLRGVRDE